MYLLQFIAFVVIVGFLMDINRKLNRLLSASAVDTVQLGKATKMAEVQREELADRADRDQS